MSKDKFEGGGLGAGQGNNRFQTTIEGQGEEVLQDAGSLVGQERGPEVSLQEAREIMGEGFYFGPEEVEKLFGIDDAPIPPIPFSEEKLRRAKELGQRLIFQVDTFNSVPNADGGGSKVQRYPLTVPNLAKHWSLPGRPPIKIQIQEHAKRGLVDSVAKKLGGKKSDAPRRGWRLTTPLPRSGTNGASYLESLDALVAFARNSVFQGNVPPEPFRDAFENYERVKNAPTMRDPLARAHAVNRLNVRKHLCERPSEAVYRLMLEKTANLPLTPDNHFIWTNEIIKPVSTMSFPIAIQVGSFGDLIQVREESMGSNDARGMCFSRGE